MRELVVSLECDFDCDSERFYAHDGQRAHQRADAHVDDGVCATAARGQALYGIEGVENDEAEVGQKHYSGYQYTKGDSLGGGETEGRGRTRLSGQIQYFVDGVYVSISWGMQHQQN